MHQNSLFEKELFLAVAIIRGNLIATVQMQAYFSELYLWEVVKLCWLQHSSPTKGENNTVQQGCFSEIPQPYCEYLIFSDKEYLRYSPFMNNDYYLLSKPWLKTFG